MRLIDEFLQLRPCTTLFHYTSARGLIGILDAGSVYASSAYHLNDSTEYRYAFDLMAEQLQVRLAFEHGTLNSAYGALLEELPSLSKNSQVLVASFSEEGDLLSQWLAYSGPSNGFALGLVPHQFERARAEGFTLVRCVYDRAKQIELVSAAIDAICQSDLNLDDEGIKRY